MLLLSLNIYIKLCDQQLGHGKVSNCAHRVIMIKEIIMQYNKENSNLHCFMIELPKIFDQINQDTIIYYISSDLLYIYSNKVYHR